MHDVVRFHADRKFLLMAYNQKEMRILGSIVANHEKKPLRDLLAEYESHLHSCFDNPPKRISNMNVLMHILGFFSKNISNGSSETVLQRWKDPVHTRSNLGP